MKNTKLFQKTGSNYYQFLRNTTQIMCVIAKYRNQIGIFGCQKLPFGPEFVAFHL